MMSSGVRRTEPFGLVLIRPKEPVRAAESAAGEAIAAQSATIDSSGPFARNIRAPGRLDATQTAQRQGSTMPPESEQRPAPPITEQMREQARQTPGSWLYIVDPGYEDAGDDVPPEGVVGAYRIDA